jgi:hypothetical protein
MIKARPCLIVPQGKRWKIASFPNDEAFADRHEAFAHCSRENRPEGNKPFSIVPQSAPPTDRYSMRIFLDVSKFGNTFRNSSFPLKSSSSHPQTLPARNSNTHLSIAFWETIPSGRT